MRHLKAAHNSELSKLKVLPKCLPQKSEVAFGPPASWLLRAIWKYVAPRGVVTLLVKCMYDYTLVRILFAKFFTGTARLPNLDKYNFPKTKKDLVVLSRQCCLFFLLKS